jgi:hypothetical protein
MINKQNVIIENQFPLPTIENKEIVNNINEPISTEVKSSQKIDSKASKIDIESKQQIRAGVYVGYPKKPVIGISMGAYQVAPVQSPASTLSYDTLKQFVYFPGVANKDFDILAPDGSFSANAFGLKTLGEDLMTSFDKIGDNFSKLSKELTSGWDYDSITSGSWSDAHALKGLFSNYLKKPKNIAKDLNIILIKFNSKLLFTAQYLLPWNKDFFNNYRNKYKETVEEISGILVISGVTSLNLISGNINENIISGIKDPNARNSFEVYNRTFNTQDISGLINKNKEPLNNTISTELYNKNHLTNIESLVMEIAELQKNQIDNGFPYIMKTVENPSPSESPVESNSVNTIITYAKNINDYKGAELIPTIKDTGQLNPTVAQETLNKQISNMRNKSIEYLVQSGADFMKHAFDIMLVCSSENSEDVNSFENFFKKIAADSSTIKINFGESADSGCFMVRAGSIDIPQIENDSFTYNFLFSKVKKVRSRIKYEKRAELKMLLDEPLIFMNFFNLLTNNNSTIFNSLHADNRYPMKFAPYSTNRLIKENIVSKKIRLDIIVKHQKLLHYSQFEELRHAWNQANDTMTDVQHFAGLDSSELPLWWFEDVNFLGQGSDLTFDRDNANTVEMNYPFLFKRCVKVNRLHKGGSNNGVRTPLQVTGESMNQLEFNLLSEKVLTKSEDADFFENQSDQEWFRNYLKSRNISSEATS